MSIAPAKFIKIAPKAIGIDIFKIDFISVLLSLAGSAFSNSSSVIPSPEILYFIKIYKNPQNAAKVIPKIAPAEASGRDAL